MVRNQFGFQNESHSNNLLGSAKIVEKPNMINWIFVNSSRKVTGELMAEYFDKHGVKMEQLIFVLTKRISQLDQNKSYSDLSVIIILIKSIAGSPEINQVLIFWDDTALNSIVYIFYSKHSYV